MADHFFGQKSIYVDEESPDLQLPQYIAQIGPLETHFPTRHSKFDMEIESPEPFNLLNDSDTEEKSFLSVGQQMGDGNNNHAFIIFQAEPDKNEDQAQQRILRSRQKLERLEERARIMSQMSKNPPKRDNNTILKPIFTKLKKLIKNHKPLQEFFDFRIYKESRVSLVDFEKLFSFAQIKGCFSELRQLLTREQEALATPPADYAAQRVASYGNYLERIYSAMTFFDNHHQRMKTLFNYRKHAPQLKLIETFRQDLIKKLKIY